MQKGNHKRFGTASSVSGGIIAGICVALAIIILGSTVLAMLINSEYIYWNYAGYGIMGIIILSSFAGSMVTCKKLKRKRLQMSIVYGLVLLCVLLFITTVLFGGKFEGALITGTLIIVSSIGAGMTDSSRNETQKRKNNRRPATVNLYKKR